MDREKEIITATPKDGSYRARRLARYQRDIPDHQFKAAVLDFLIDDDRRGLDVIKSQIIAVKKDIPKK